MMQAELMNLYEAVLNNDGKEVKKLLNENLLSNSQIPVRTLTGLLVIAVDGKLANSSNAIIDYNNNNNEKIPDLHYNAILCLAAKSNFLDQLNITRH